MMRVGSESLNADYKSDTFSPLPFFYLLSIMLSELYVLKMIFLNAAAEN